MDWEKLCLWQPRWKQQFEFSVFLEFTRLKTCGFGTPTSQGWQGRARVAAGEGCNRGPLCPALQKSKAAAKIHPHVSPRRECAVPAAGYSSSSSRPGERAGLRPRSPGQGRAGQRSPQPPAAASDIPLLRQAMKISPTGLEQPSGGERLANIPSLERLWAGGVTTPGVAPSYSPKRWGLSLWQIKTSKNSLVLSHSCGMQAAFGSVH